MVIHVLGQAKRPRSSDAVGERYLCLQRNTRSALPLATEGTQELFMNIILIRFHQPKTARCLMLQNPCTVPTPGLPTAAHALHP